MFIYLFFITYTIHIALLQLLFMLIDFVLLWYVLSIMWLFAVFFLPSILILYFLTHVNRNKVFSVLFGVGLGAVYVIFAILFGSEYRIVPADLFKNFRWIFLHDVFLPAIIVTALFFLLSRDSFKFKINVLFLVLSGFYVMYIPFRILFRSGAFAFFTLFFKPILLTCFVLGFSFAIRLFYKNLKGAKNVLMFILPVLLGLCCTMAPALAEVFWFSGSPVISWLFVGMLEILLTLVLVALNHVNFAAVGKKQSVTLSE